MNWFEELPNNCPPNDAEEPNGRVFYRLCKNNPTDSKDFFSQKKDNPDNKFSGISECILRAVSVWDNREKCLGIKKFPTQRDKIVGEIVLNNSDGLIKSTFKQHHYSWWRGNSFNPEIVINTDS